MRASPEWEVSLIPLGKSLAIAPTEENNMPTFCEGAKGKGKKGHGSQSSL